MPARRRKSARQRPADSDLHRVIALSAAPAPPAAEVSVPQGNAAARIAISPDGKQPGVPGGSEHGVAGNGGTGGHPDSAGGTNGAGGATHGSGGGGNGNANSLPAAISITGGSNNGTSGSGGIGSAGSRPSGKLNLKLAPSAEPTRSSHRVADRRISSRPERGAGKNTIGKRNLSGARQHAKSHQHHWKLGVELRAAR